MIAKILISILTFVAMYPNVETLTNRLLIGSAVIGGLSGLVGTAARLEAVGMIPINALYAAVISVPTTIILHYATKAFRNASSSFGSMEKASST